MTEELHDLAAPYVVDALEPEELADFEAHLADCRACQQEVTDMREVTLWLAEAEQVEPPSTLRSSVLDLIDRTPQEPATVTPPAETPRHRSDADSTADVVQLPERRSSRLPYLVAAAAVLIALVCGGIAIQQHRDANSANDARAELVQLLGANDVRVGTATGTNGGSGTVVVSKSQGRAVFVANRLPDLQAGKVYELWTLATPKTAPVPAGTFTPEQDVSLISLPDAALSAAAVAVSIEPAGGSTTPTTVIMAVAPKTTG